MGMFKIPSFLSFPFFSFSFIPVHELQWTLMVFTITLSTNKEFGVLNKF